MNNQICFIVDGIELYLDKDLVMFNDIPIFFICKDSNKKYYLVLCTDVDDFNYIIVDIKFSVLYEMLKQQISMKNAIISAKYFWNVQSGDNIFDDIVKKSSIKNIDNEVLPLEDAFYEPVTEQDKLYVENIESKYLSSLVFVDKIKEDVELSSSVNIISNIEIQIDDEMCCLFSNTITLSPENEIIQYSSEHYHQYNNIDNEDFLSIYKKSNQTIYLAA